ncbi:tape measure protein [Salmonella enterica subsp. enterica serovar Thompson]|nr:tape measure protein [Salmonella enterica]EHF4167662.1 tape measure protein [Salmonella enterica subsp. enterica serovar Thompson]ELV5264596.1 tape measure protein [Salmonella enterica]
MAGQRLRASIIIDLMGNIAQRSRQFAGNLSSMAHSGQTALRGLRSSVIGVSDSIDRLGASATGTFRTLTAGALGVAGMGYTANKLFISIASTRENQRIALNSLYKGDKEHADKMMQWAIQNAKDSTWGLTGVMQEFTSSKAFGMSDEQTKNFITMLQDQGALKGWDLNAAQGASMQLKQMFARQQITAADANLLTGYGINAYQTLAERFGKTQQQVRDQGNKGLLGPKSIHELFKALSEEAKGAQGNAMNSWTGLTAQMGDVWEDFADKLMNKGPFERLKGQLRDVLGWYDRVSVPDASGLSELDRITDQLAGNFNTAFNIIQRTARQTWRYLRAGKNALSWVDENIVSLKTLAKVIGGVWLANKALRAGAAVVRPTWQAATSPYRAYRWWRGRNNGGSGPASSLPGITANPSLIQHVFVTNWPVGGFGSGDYIAGDGKRKRGPGRGRSRKVPVVPPAAPVVATRAGFMSRIFGGAGRIFGSVGRTISGAGRTAGNLFTSAGKAVANSGIGRMVAGAGRTASSLLGTTGRLVANSAIGRVASKGMGALSWMGKVGGRLFSRLGGPLLSAAAVAPVLLDDNATLQDKSSAVGGTAGAWAGGAIGSLVGPLGTVAGATLGGVVGDYLGGFVADLYSKWNEPKYQTPPPEQKVSANASLRVELADGLRITSTTVNEDGMGMDVFTGNNFLAW